MSTARPATMASSNTLGDILERVLDKGIVVAGDITVTIGEVELLSIKIRLIVASVDKAKEMGIDWWRNDKMLSGMAGETADDVKQLEQERERLRLELENEKLRAQLEELRAPRALQAGARSSDDPDPST